MSLHRSGGGHSVLRLGDGAVLDETWPSNIFMQEAWATGEGKRI